MMRQGARQQRVWSGVVILAIIFATPIVFGQTRPAPQDSNAPEVRPRRGAHIDPVLFVLRDILHTLGPDAALFDRVRPHPEGPCVLIQRHTTPSPTAASSPHISRTRVGWGALEDLAADPSIARVEACWAPVRLVPLEETARRVGAAQARMHPQDHLDGAGTVIADIDSGVDVLHPALFFADGGVYPWIDLNGDGRLGAGDGVDLDADDEVEFNEVIRILDATTVRDFATGAIDNQDGVLQPHRDWVYIDRNRDRMRNAGAAVGFLESDPAYGEPIFVPDDANGDGVLDPSERLVRLKTSKIKRYVDVDEVYERGDNLIDAAQATGRERSIHGTGVTGILVGGQPPYHDRIGVAPGAEVLVYGHGIAQSQIEDPREETGLQFGFIEDASSEADIILHEWTNPFVRPLDGTTLLEEKMAEVAAHGVLHVTPMGNLNDSNKHIVRRVEVGTPTRLELVVGEGWTSGDTQLPYESFVGSLQWSGGQPLSITLTDPEGTEVVLDPAQTMQSIDDAFVSITDEVTPKNTRFMRFFVYSADDGVALTEGTWTLTVSGATDPVEVWGRITDLYSGWESGITWREGTEDRGTLSFPATAPVALGVGASGGRADVRAYSGRGPTLDGRVAVGLVAPDDPFVPIGLSERLITAGWGAGWFGRFGGTSGASPHVAGAAALLLQQDPTRGSAQLIEALTASAMRAPDDLGRVPDARRGWGYLDVYEALFGTPAPTQPQGRIDVGLTVEVDPATKRVRFIPSIEETEPLTPPLMLRLDVNYDGAWDAEWASSDAPTTWTFAEIEALAGRTPRAARLDVRDARGAYGGAAALYALQSTGGEEMGAREEMDMGEDLGGGEAPEPGGCLCRAVSPSHRAPPWYALWASALMCALATRRRIR